VIVVVGAELYEPAAEDTIVSQWTAVSADENHWMRERVDEIVHGLGPGTRLVVIRRANGLALFFTCMSLSAVMSLSDHWGTGQLRDIVKELFTFLFGSTMTVHVKRLSWSETDYERCLEFFGSLQGKQTV